MSTTSQHEARIENSAGAAGIIAVVVFITCIFCILWQCCKGDRKSNEETISIQTARPSVIGERTPLTRHTSIASNVPPEPTSNVGWNPFVLNMKSPIEKRFPFAPIPYDDEKKNHEAVEDLPCPAEEPNKDVENPSEGFGKTDESRNRPNPFYTGEESFPHLLDRLQGSDQANCKDETQIIGQEEFKMAEELHSVEETKK